MRPLKEKWSQKKYGIQLSQASSTNLTNLRFADDILLVGRSLPQIKAMLSDVAAAAAEVGLDLHPDKPRY